MLYRYLQYVSQLQPHKKEKKNHALVNQNYEIKNSKRDQKVIIIRLKMLKFWQIETMKYKYSTIQSLNYDISSWNWDLKVRFESGIDQK